MCAPIDAFPDSFSHAGAGLHAPPGLTPEELESRVTQPIELAMKGIPNLVMIAVDDPLFHHPHDVRIRRGDGYLLGTHQVNERLGEVQNQCRPCRRRDGAIVTATRGDADVHHRGRRARSAAANATSLTGLFGRRCAACPRCRVNVLGGFRSNLRVVESRRDGRPAASPLVAFDDRARGQQFAMKRRSVVMAKKLCWIEPKDASRRLEVSARSSLASRQAG